MEDKVKIGFTGTREGMNGYQLDMFIRTIELLFRKDKVTEFHHGDCIGADAQSHGLIRKHFGTVRVYLHPPNNSRARAYCPSDYTFPVKSYLTRNKDIVDVTDVLIAAPRTNVEVVRSGTWSTIRYARRVSKEVIMLRP